MAALQFDPERGVVPATDNVQQPTGNHGFPDGAIPADPRMFRLSPPEPTTEPPRRLRPAQPEDHSEPVSLAKIKRDLTKRRKHVESAIRRLRAELEALESESRDIGVILEPKPTAQLALVTPKA